jgi:hypothetical protein
MDGWGRLKLRTLVVLVALACLVVLACKPGALAPAPTNAPARLESIAGTDLKQVTLTQEAADRIGVRTTAVREQQMARKRIVGAEVIASDVGPVVIFHATPSDLARIDRLQPARVQLLVARDRVLPDTRGGGGAGTTSAGIPARSAERPAGVPDQPSGTLYYFMEGRSITPGQRVLLEVPLVGGTGLRKIVPYSAVLYDLRGDTWTYTRPAPLTYVRQRVTLDYIEGEVAVLLDGPSIGTDVVTVGAIELFGAEFRVGK